MSHLGKIMFISILKSFISLRFAVSIWCFSSGILQKCSHHLPNYLHIVKEISQCISLILKDFQFCFGCCFHVGSKYVFKPQQVWKINNQKELKESVATIATL